MTRQDEMVFSFLLLFSLVMNHYLTPALSSGRGVNICTTPSNKTGVCSQIKDCPVLVELLRQNQTSSTSLVKDSICGFEGLDSLVCCPVKSPVTSLGSGQDTVYSDEQCGHVYSGENKIRGGNNATLGEWPWLAALGYTSSGKPGIEWLCGGALVTKQHVITAAHCINVPSQYTIKLARLGDLNLDDDVNDGATPVDIEIDKSLSHPNHDPKRKVNDIAIIRLRSVVKFTEFIRPICLPNTPYFKSNSLAGQIATVAGWGKLYFGGQVSKVLQQVDLKIVDDNICRDAYGSFHSVVIDSRVMCAGTTRKSACQGDSGGPLTLNYNLTYYLVGLVSYGKGCGEPGYPGVAIRVSSFLDWINNNLN